MKAAFLTEPGELTVCERPMPIPKAGEVLIRVKATAICGTDVSIYKGRVPAKYPVIQGHESVGEIVEVGEGVGGFQIGDPVIMNPAYFCGDCFYCQKGLYNLCEHGGLLGRDKDGTFAEYIAISSTALTLLPKNISFEDATTLQALATALRGWERLEAVEKVGPDSTVLVMGLGTPGLLFSRLAAMAGAKVFSCTRSQWKLDIAQKFGAIPVNSTKENVVEIVKDATNGRGADFVIDSAGSVKTFQTAIEAARLAATILDFGFLHDLAGVDGYNIYFKELNIVGSRAMNNAGYKKAVELYKQGALDLSPLITDRFTLEETKENFDKMDAESGKHLRMVCTI